MVNATVKSQTLAINLTGINTRGGGTLWRLNRHEPRRGQQGWTATGLPRSLSLPPVSTSIFEYPVVDLDERVRLSQARQGYPALVQPKNSARMSRKLDVDSR